MTVNISKPSINIREKIAELDKPSGIAGEAVLRADSVQEIRNQIGAGRKNLLINGDFRVSQRGDYTSVTALASAIYYLDRWVAYRSNINGTLQTVPATINGISKTAYRLVATNSVSGELAMQQRLENQDIPNGSTVTLSAWVKSDTNAGLRYYNGASWSNITPHSGSGEWEKLSVTYSVANTTSYYAVQVITNTTHTNSYFEFTDVQLELGSVATDFEHRSYGEELALCQRYYVKQYGAWSFQGSRWVNEHFCSIPHPVTMRGLPTFTSSGAGAFQVFTAGGNVTSTSNTLGVATIHSTEILVGSSRTHSSAFIRAATTTSWFSLDAEL